MTLYLIKIFHFFRLKGKDVKLQNTKNALILEHLCRPFYIVLFNIHVSILEKSQRFYIFWKKRNIVGKNMPLFVLKKMFILETH